MTRSDRLVILIPCLVIGAVFAFAQIDYTNQIRNAPRWGSGLIVTQQPGQPQHVMVSGVGVLREHVFAGGEPVIAPGPCVIADQIDSQKYEVASNTVLKTPSGVYLCLPDGTGNGFRWAKLAIALTWSPAN